MPDLINSFRRNPVSFCSRYTVLVNETAVANDVTNTFNTSHGNNRVLTTTNWVKSFDIGLFGHGQRTLNIKPSNTQGCRSCYFLPYLKDHSTTITLGNAANWFFTSTVTGCTVRASGNTQHPVVSHANASTTYTNAQSAALPVDPITGHPISISMPTISDHQRAQIERVASISAQNRINVLLPNIGAHTASGSVKKADYIARCNATHFTWGKNHFSMPKRNYSFNDDITMGRTSAGKPEVSVFIWGQRRNNNWRFYYQTSIPIQGTFKVKRFFGKANKNKQVYGNSIILGTPVRFFG